MTWELATFYPVLLSVLTASLVGSLHCAGMCGPFVTVYSVGGTPGARKGPVWPLHVAYHAGRALTYTAVGALGGALGSFVDWAGQFAGMVRVAAWGSSLILIVWGLGVLFPRLKLRSPLDDVLGRRLVQLRKKPPLVRASLLGGLTPLLPCGWFYAFALAAAGTGGWDRGALLMFVFWLGTVPALVGVGAFMTRLGNVLRPRAPLVTGVILIAIGLWGVVVRVQHPLDLRAQPSSRGVPQTGQGKCH